MDERSVKAIGDLAALAGAGKHQGTAKAILHQVDEAETSVFRVRPGGRIKAHSHTEVWDLFIGLEGRAEIACPEAGPEGRMTLGPRAFLAVPPGVPHEVHNPDPEADAVFILIHAPYAGYDFVPVPG